MGGGEEAKEATTDVSAGEHPPTTATNKSSSSSMTNNIDTATNESSASSPAQEAEESSKTTTSPPVDKTTNETTAAISTPVEPASSGKSNNKESDTKNPGSSSVATTVTPPVTAASTVNYMNATFPTMPGFVPPPPLPMMPMTQLQQQHHFTLQPGRMQTSMHNNHTIPMTINHCNNMPYHYMPMMPAMMMPTSMPYMPMMQSQHPAALPNPSTLFQRDGSYRSVDSAARGAGSTEPFPEKLHRLIREVELDKQDHIISFVGPFHFAIHKPDTFASKIIPKYFRSNRLASFKRQLQLYGFEYIRYNKSAGSSGDDYVYYHPMFAYGKPELCRNMKRINAPPKAAKLKQQPTT